MKVWGKRREAREDKTRSRHKTGRRTVRKRERGHKMNKNYRDYKTRREPQSSLKCLNRAGM